ncbi:YebC/PmpR family DNA-binding transcriptional regulator [Candidatus Microgenomates bacterium]|nr:YebC/PmpR family DNA-binding transcriptional regulator [Candidatus Microgenomates bacterium]
MSGHSKWAQIKRKKGATDAKRGQAFTKLAKAIAIAAREGADPEMNFKLRLAVDRARAMNMPAANIDKAIERGGGKGSEHQLTAVTYEGYGPARVAVLVECATDNRNRAAAAVRAALNKHGGSMASPGSVAYLFSLRGVILVETNQVDEVSLAAIDAGATDVESDGQTVTIYTEPKQLAAVRQRLESAGYQLVSAELSYSPQQVVAVNDVEAARKIVRLMEVLEELEDVTAVYSNFDIPIDILEAVAT